MSDFNDENNGNNNNLLPVTALTSIRDTQAIVDTVVSRNRMIDDEIKRVLDDDELFQATLPYLAPNGSDAGGKFQAHTIVALKIRDAGDFSDVKDLTLREMWTRIHKYLLGRGMEFENGFVVRVRAKQLTAA